MTTARKPSFINVVSTDPALYNAVTILWHLCPHNRIRTSCSRTSLSVFTARCILVQSAVLRSHVVCLSVCLSVMLVDCDHIGWNSSKIISPSVSLGCSLFATQTSRVYTPRETPWNFARIGVGCWKKWLSAYKSSTISETRQDRTKVTIEVE